MSESSLDNERLRRAILVILALGISALFLWMIRHFLTPLLLAAILSGMSHPLYRRLLRRFGRRRALASATTLAIIMLVVIAPITAFLSVVASQAFSVSQAAGPRLAALASADEVRRIWGELPLPNAVLVHRDQILPKLAEFGSTLGTFAVGVLTLAAEKTATFFLLLFVMLYATFFFLMDGRRLLDKILYYLPLPPEDEVRMVERFVSVTRATLKGTLVIGLLQGALGGLGFWGAGIGGAAFWATMMAVASAIPGVGTALVWLPGVVYLAAIQHWSGAVGLLLWCVLVVSTVDTVLRPRMVGKDTKLPDLLILLSTLGGIVLFGALGFIIGPIVAALFVTVWDLYGAAFKGLLPESEPSPPSFAPPPRK